MFSEKEISVLVEEVKRLQSLVEKQETVLSEKETIITEKEADIAVKKERIAYLERLVFGQKREKFETPNRNQLILPFELDAETEQQIQAFIKEKQEAKAKEAAEKKSEKRPHPGRHPLPTHLEVVETIIEPEGDLSEMVLVGQEITEELEFQPAKYYIHRIIRKKYAPKSGQGAFKIAELPPRVIDKGIAGAGIITQAIIDKYVDHLPIYRQLQRFARENIPIKEATLYGWVQQGLSKLEILYDYLWEHQVRCGYLQVDETTIMVLESEKQNAAHLGYYWVYNDPIADIPLFKYQKGRSGSYPQEQLKDFQGYLQTDGYAGYAKLAAKATITYLSCWVHVRREFERALDNNKELAQTGLILIQALYAIEKEAKDLSPEQRKELRLSKALPIINQFFKWSGGHLLRELPKSQIAKAFRYATERSDSLYAYLYNGNLHIDNNAVENSLRPVAIGRKNYLFAKTHETAQRAAMIYSFMAICKKHNVNPFDWLKNTLSIINQTSIQDLHNLLPQNFNLQ